MRDKKAVSAVVATVLIILITVAAVTIIWAAIIPMIKQQLGSGTTCLDAVSQVSLVTDQGYTCLMNKDNGSISLQVRHGPKAFDLAWVQVVVAVEGNTYPATINASLPGQNEERVYYIENASFINATSISIAPVIKVGNTYDSCDISSETTLRDCTS